MRKFARFLLIILGLGMIGYAAYCLYTSISLIKAMVDSLTNQGINEWSSADILVKLKLISMILVHILMAGFGLTAFVAGIRGKASLTLVITAIIMLAAIVAYMVFSIRSDSMESEFMYIAIDCVIVVLYGIGTTMLFF